MEFKRTQVEKLTILNAPDLDPVNVFLESFPNNRGRIIVECFGEAWAATFGAMGCADIARFIDSAGVDYLANKMLRGDAREVDYDLISKVIGVECECIGDLALCGEVEQHYGEDWHYHLPQRDTTEFRYLKRILTAVKLTVASGLVPEAVAADA